MQMPKTNLSTIKNEEDKLTYATARYPRKNAKQLKLLSLAYTNSFRR